MMRRLPLLRLALLFFISVICFTWWDTLQKFIGINNDFTGQPALEISLWKPSTTSSNVNYRSSIHDDDERTTIPSQNINVDELLEDSYEEKLKSVEVFNGEDNRKEKPIDDDDDESSVDAVFTEDDTEKVESSVDVVVTSTSDDAEKKVISADGIPHRLVFTYKWNLLERQEPKRFYDNVMRTIHAYQTVWDDCTVAFLDDDACRETIATTAPILLEYFDREMKGSFRSDICRVVYLYAYGGYYFDIDMELIHEPFLLDSKMATFGTAVEAGAGHFFQSFLVSQAGNPILQRSFDKIRLYYEDRTSSRQYVHMGPYTLKAAFDEWEGANATLLQEVNLEDHAASYYPDLPRRKGKGCCCNYILLYKDVPYFYSRMVGAGFHCDFP